MPPKFEIPPPKIFSSWHPGNKKYRQKCDLARACYSVRVVVVGESAKREALSNDEWGCFGRLARLYQISIFLGSSAFSWLEKEDGLMGCLAWRVIVWLMANMT